MPLTQFTAIANKLAKRLRRLQESHSLFQITLYWMSIIQEREEAQLRELEGRCETARKLATLVGSTSLDPKLLFGKQTASDLETLRIHAQRLVRAASPGGR